jgi:NTP pyrophosphatase (non-canonical NTP hydrolase)
VGSVARIAVGVDASEALEQRTEFQEAVRRQAEDLLEGLLAEVGETVEGIDVQPSVVEDREAAARPPVTRPEAHP